jgi:hypothetical protein
MFDPGSVLVGYVVDKVALRQGFREYFGLTQAISFRRCSINRNITTTTTTTTTTIIIIIIIIIIMIMIMIIIMIIIIIMMIIIIIMIIITYNRRTLCTSSRRSHPSSQLSSQHCPSRNSYRKWAVKGTNAAVLWTLPQLVLEKSGYELYRDSYFKVTHSAHF